MKVATVVELDEILCSCGKVAKEAQPPVNDLGQVLDWYEDWFGHWQPVGEGAVLHYSPDRGTTWFAVTPGVLSSEVVPL